jgi:uncharacterized membrane protein YwzB
MIGTLIGLVFFLIIVGVIWWALQQLLALIPLAEPFATLVRVLVVVIGVIVVLYIAAALLSLAGIHVNSFNLR